MVAQAMRLARAGWTVMVPDLYGTGDSDGASFDATLHIWRQDLNRAAHLAKAKTPGPLVLWGVRMGALLAADALPWLDTTVDALVFWQAPANGKAAMGGLLKLARVGTLVKPGSPGNLAVARAETSDIQARISGETAMPPDTLIELGGYRLRQGLIDDLCALTLNPLDICAAHTQVPGAWPATLFLGIQRTAGPNSPAPGAQADLAARWAQSGGESQARAAAGEPFWSSMEPSSPQATFAATELFLAERFATVLASTAGSDPLQAEKRPLPSLTNPSNPSNPSNPANRPNLLNRPNACQPGDRKQFTQRTVIIEGEQGPMMGILTTPVGTARAAVLIVAGQPQTRVGAHRMFVDLTQGLANHGMASLRFDVGGWGDSPGDAREFEASAPDIARAAAFLKGSVPATTPLWLWGLCDGACAAVLAMPQLRRTAITPQVICMVNPWVRSDASLADAIVRTYYARRILDPDFWRRLVTGKVTLRNLLAEPVKYLRTMLLGRPAEAAPADTGVASASSTVDLPSLLLAQLLTYRGEILTVLSGNDLTAGETEALMKRDSRWRKKLDRPKALFRIPGADHTFSRSHEWQTVIDWLGEHADTGS